MTSSVSVRQLPRHDFVVVAYVERFTGSKLIVTLAVADDEPEVRTGFLSFDCPVPDAVIGVRVVIRVSPPALGDCAGVVFRILAISKTDDVACTVLSPQPCACGKVTG